MLIDAVSKRTKLTKKAIEYYTEQGLVRPSVLENGYRDFHERDVERLEKTAVLRKLGIGIAGIRQVLSDETTDTLKRLSVMKELQTKREEKKKKILDRLSSGAGYNEIRGELQAIEESATITEKLLDAFPGYYGRFVCMHFARFLNEPIVTDEQKAAYEEILHFLDNVPELKIPPDVLEFMTDNTKHIETEHINTIMEAMEKSIKNPEEFLSANKVMLEEFMNIKQSEEYKNSPAFKFECLLKEFNQASGYNDRFIPAMKILSSSYAAYYKQLEQAGEYLINNMNLKKQSSKEDMV